MISIYLSGKGGREGYPFEHFKHYFLDICHSHHEEGRALAFAFILYDFNHPEIIKTLHDQDYWKALDCISGKYLTVFSFHHFDRRSRSDDFKNSQQFIEERFGIELSKARPSVLFFQITNGQVSVPFAVEIQSETVQQAFVEIRGILSDVVDSLKEVMPEFRHNTAETFNLITNRLWQRKAVLSLRKVLGLVGSAQELVDKLHKL
jgi:hypothetical protein